MYVSGRVDIFDMVDIDLFTVVALNMIVLKLGYTGKSEPMFYNYLKPLTSLDEGLYALACEEDVRCLGTLVKSFKLIEVCIEHGVTALDSYLRAPRFRATLEEITDDGYDVGRNSGPILLGLSIQEPFVVEVSNDLGNGEDAGQVVNGQEVNQLFAWTHYYYDDEGNLFGLMASDLHPNSNFNSRDRHKNTYIACDPPRHIHENIKQGWCGQAYKDLLWRAASATNVRDFEKCMLELKTMNPKAHEWLNKIPAEHWARSHFSGRAKSDLLLNNICEVFNGKIVGGRDKPVITLLEYIREYCMKRIVNVQGVIDKCTGPLTPTATRIMESIKKEAHLMKVQWNRANKYQVSALLGDQSCWNMALNDRAAPPLETWVNPCYWLSTWKETYSHKIQPICGTKYWEKSTCPTTLLPPEHHVQVGRPRKKRKRSKHKDEPFVKDGKVSRKGRTITCQSCGNTGHNMATCKGQGRKATTGGNNAEASGSASGQAQQIEPAVGQDGLGGSGAGAVIGLSAAAGEGGAGVASQGSSRSRWTKRRVQTERISPQKRTPTQPASQPSTSSQVRVSETKNADGREMGDGVPTQSSVVGGASEWSFL
ncbi:hypothetical protein Tco_0580981 [Tanacetum coccineum]